MATDPPTKEEEKDVFEDSNEPLSGTSDGDTKETESQPEEKTNKAPETENN